MKIIGGKARVPERAFLEHVIGLARLRSRLWFHDYATSRRMTCHRCGAPQKGPLNPPGFPDLWVPIPERETLLAAELKSMDGRATRHQGAWLTALRACKTLTVRIWRPQDEDEIREVLG